MKFNVVLNTAGNRTFKRFPYMNGEDCIEGNKGEISVVTSEGERATEYLSVEPGKVLLPVKVGDHVSIQEKVNGSLVVHFYKVFSITDTEVICGPIE